MKMTEENKTLCTGCFHQTKTIEKKEVKLVCEECGHEKKEEDKND